MNRGFLPCISAVLILLLGGACLDLRDFEGTWTGARVGEAAELRVGLASDASATL